MAPAKPPMAYYGAKTSLAPRIVSLFGDHKRYVEPFAGSLAVLLAKPPARHEVVNDLDYNLMTFWKVLRDSPEELARVCMLTPHSRMERNIAKHIPSDSTDLERARLVWSALVQGRTGTLANTGWRHARSSVDGRMLRSYVQRIETVAERVRDVSLECRPAVEVIEKYGSDENTLLYCDPPYLGSTRRHNYKVEMTSDAQHRELGEVLSGCRATVVLSGYHSPLYDELYGDWFRVELPSRTSQGSLQRVERTEVLWSNRELKTRYISGQNETDVTGFEPLCGRCGRVIPRPKRGPRGVWCSGACRVAAHRARRDVGGVAVGDDEAAG
ncbi:DNA adenine methylase [Mycobacteroides abscessus]|uniref:DNA adenine methylase n=1 Tax=Mycobacteroides abscessus TaxID=36809 RepID=UPI0005DC7535|nr:DNA adenine methylase [Mycobacteroides abscessus]CPW83077.1 D12 class N6 adenine-specific DNA methyltransferase [Mycobacteroides abscessus]SHX21094.1 D12 class N6 adenine-specific DNA methyltransferase [Mycobacteroides abscessus subsp. abscessus]